MQTGSLYEHRARHNFYAFNYLNNLSKPKSYCMSNLHEHSKQDSSMSTLILIAVIILGLLYFLVKGCTNSSEDEVPSTHHASIQIVRQPMLAG
jgi:hypothetical protein